MSEAKYNIVFGSISPPEKPLIVTDKDIVESCIVCSIGSKPSPISYRAHPGLNQSSLKLLKKSPKHFWDKYINPNAVKDEPTAAMKFGTMIDNAILSPTEHEKLRFIGTNEVLLVGGIATNTLNSEYILGCKIRDNVIDKGAHYLMGGEAHKQIYWDMLGIECKAELDYYIPPCKQFPKGLIVDIKTTRDASPDGFTKSILDYGYYNQAAWYREAIFYTESTRPWFLFIAIENKPPYDCAFYELDDGFIDDGEYENLELLRLYKSCMESGNWPGYPSNIKILSMPSWYRNTKLIKPIQDIKWPL